jgi:hypothetical protein
MDLLIIDQIAFSGIAAEIYTNIYYHLKLDSPLSKTIMVTNTNGRQGYIGDDASYGIGYFPLKSSKASQSCGEKAIVNFFVDGIRQRLTAERSQ